MKNLKISLTIAATLLLAPSAVFGWVLPIGNTSPYTAYLRVSYPSCNADNIVIPAGGQVNVNAKGCLVKQISGFLMVNPADHRESIRINWYVSGHRDFSATIAKQPNGTWGISARY